MAAACWTCRSVVEQVIAVYVLVAEDDSCPICLQSSPQLCVAVPCGHHICGDCSRDWARRQANFVKVPGGPVAPGPAMAVAPVGAQVMPPPWPVAPPQVRPAAPAAAPLLPAIGLVFEFHGRPVLWVQLWRFGTSIVLVYQDTGRLCQDGSYSDPPAAVPGWLVKWHKAGLTANRKWVTSAEVHDV